MGGPFGTLAVLLWFLGTITLTGSALVFVLWLVLAAARRRRRAFAIGPAACPGCAYELPASGEQTCPECAHRSTETERRETHLGEMRAARRTRICLAAAVTGIGLGAGMMAVALLLS